MIMGLNNHVSMKHFNSFAVCADADQLAVLSSAEQLPELLPVLAKHQKRLILGGGSNILLTSDFRGLVVINQLKGIRILEDDTDSVVVEAGAGENWHAFVCWCIENGFHGLENLSLIPGTVGASPIQNIGAYGVEIEDFIESVLAVDLHSNKQVKFQKHDCDFAYRDSIFKHRLDRYIITAVRFRLSRLFSPVLEYSGVKEKLLELQLHPRSVTAQQLSRAICELRRLKLPDPSLIGNAGSFFKNPLVSTRKYLSLKADHPSIPMHRISDTECKISAAWLIDQCGFKGFRIGDAGVYAHHALVLVNYGKASGGQLWQLARTIQDAVENMSGIVLVPEPRIL